MKICPKCNQEKPFSDFYKNSKKKDGYQVYCKLCSSGISSTHYTNNKEHYHKRTNHNRKANAKWLLDFKTSLKCEVCEEYYVSCLEFHHLNPDEKEGSISNMANSGFSKEKILAEVSKCIVLCSNCHKKIHSGFFSILPVCNDSMV